MLRGALVIVLVGSALVVAACGFHWRGAATLDPALNPIAIDPLRAGSALLPPLRRALVDAGAVLAPIGDAQTVLRITADVAGQRVVAVTPQGQPREAELFYTVEFELVGADGVVVQRRELTLRREFAIDERDILGKTHEAEVLSDALLEEMVANIVRLLVAKP